MFVSLVVSESEPSDAETLLSSSDSDWEEEGEGDISGDSSCTKIRLEPSSEDERFSRDRGDVMTSNSRNADDHIRSPSSASNGERTSYEKTRFDMREQRHNVTYSVDSGCKQWYTSRYRFPRLEADTYLSDSPDDDTMEPNTKSNSLNQHPHPGNSVEEHDGSVVEAQSSCSAEELGSKNGDVSRRLSEDSDATHVTLLADDTAPKCLSSSQQVRRCPLLTEALPRRSVKDLLALFNLIRPGGVTVNTDSQSGDRDTPDTRPPRTNKPCVASQSRSNTLDVPKAREDFRRQEAGEPSRNVRSTAPVVCAPRHVEETRCALGRTLVPNSLCPQELDREALPKSRISSMINRSRRHSPVTRTFESIHSAGKCSNSIPNGRETDSTVPVVPSSSRSSVRPARESESGVTTASHTPLAGCRQLGARRNDMASRSAQDSSPVTPSLTESTPVSPAEAKCKVWLSSNFSSWRKMFSTASVPAKPIETTPKPHKTAMSVQFRRSRSDTEADSVNMADDECSDTDTTACSTPVASPRPAFQQRSVNNERHVKVVSRHVTEKGIGTRKYHPLDRDVDMFVDAGAKSPPGDNHCTHKALNGAVVCKHIIGSCSIDYAPATAAVLHNADPRKPAHSNSDIAGGTVLRSSSGFQQKHAISSNKNVASNHHPRAPTAERMPTCGKNHVHKTLTLPVRQPSEDNYSVSRCQPSTEHGNSPSRQLSRNDNKNTPRTEPEGGTVYDLTFPLHTPSGTSFRSAHGESAQRSRGNHNTSTPDRVSSTLKAGHVLAASTSDGTPTRTTQGCRWQFDSETCRTPQASDLFSKLKVNSPRLTPPASGELAARRRTGAAASPSLLFAKLKLQSPSVRLGDEHTHMDRDAVAVLGSTAIPLLTIETQKVNESHKHVRRTPMHSAQKSTDLLDGAQKQMLVDADKPIRHFKSASSKKTHDVASPTYTGRPAVDQENRNDKVELESRTCSLGESRPCVIPPRDASDGLAVRRPAGHGRSTGGVSSVSSVGKHDDSARAEERRSRRRLGFRDLEERCAPRRSNQPRVVEATRDDLARRTMKQDAKSTGEVQHTHVVTTRVRSGDTSVTEKNRFVSELRTTAAKCADDVASQRKTVCITSSPVEGALVDSESDPWNLSSIHDTANVPAAVVPSSSSDDCRFVPVKCQLPSSPTNISTDSSHVTGRCLSRHALFDSDSSDDVDEDTFCTLVGSPTAKQRLSSKHVGDKTSLAKSDSGLGVYDYQSASEASFSMYVSPRKDKGRLRHELRGGLRAVECVTGKSTLESGGGRNIYRKLGSGGHKETHQFRQRTVEVDTARRVYSRTNHLAATDITGGRCESRGNYGREATRQKRARGDSDDDTFRRYNTPVKRANLSYDSRHGMVRKLDKVNTSNSTRKHGKINRSTPVLKQGKLSMPVISCPGPGRCTKPFCFSCVTDSF